MYVSTLTSEIMDSMVAVENAVEGALERQTTIRASLHWRKKTAVYQRCAARIGPSLTPPAWSQNVHAAAPLAIPCDARQAAELLPLRLHLITLGHRQNTSGGLMTHMTSEKPGSALRVTCTYIATRSLP